MAYLLLTYLLKIKQFWQRSSLTYWYMLLLAVCLVACKKEAEAIDTDIDQTDTITVTSGNYYKLLRVENFQGDTTDTDPTAPKTTIYYSLDAKTVRPLSYQKTTKWDLAFAGLYNSFLSANNGSDVKNYGYATAAAGGILIVKKSFESVIEVPADSLFKTGNDVVGTDNAGAFGVGTGWYLYDFSGNIVGDLSYDKQHVCYALGNGVTLSNGDKIEPRTIVVRTAAGNYAKIKMISVYKNAFTSDKWFRNTPHMYYTFEYVMVPKGSTSFEIK